MPQSVIPQNTGVCQAFDAKAAADTGRRPARRKRSVRGTSAAPGPQLEVTADDRTDLAQMLLTIQITI